MDRQSNLSRRPCPIPEFDEDLYLEKNPDLREALAKSHLSPWEHYVYHGFYTGRAGGPETWDPAIARLMFDSENHLLPPPHLAAKAHPRKPENYYRAARLVTLNLLSALTANQIEIPGHARILDFGCSCARIISTSRRIWKDAQFFGTDIHREAIHWCWKNVPSLAQFAVNDTHPPLDYEHDFFDMVIVISVFTHLPEDLQFMWLEELRRIIRPGGVLLITVHGKECFQNHSFGQRDDVRSSEFSYWRERDTEGLPDFYQTAIHSEKYVRSEWSRYFEIVDYIEQGIGRFQSLVVCRNGKK